MSDRNNFDVLAQNVQHVHKVTSVYAKGAVNQLLTARNWAIARKPTWIRANWCRMS